MVAAVYVQELVTRSLLLDRHPTTVSQEETTEILENDRFLVSIYHSILYLCLETDLFVFLDREKDPLDASSQGTEQSSNKRQKLIRNRYNAESANMAKKTLPIDPLASDRLQGRKD